MIVSQLDKNCLYPLKEGNHYIYDNHLEHKPRIVKKDDKWNLEIVNNSEELVNFFQNDACLMTLNDLKKCDWLLIFKNSFYFIEAKDVGNVSRKKEERQSAIAKFDDTIPFYLAKYPFLSSMKLFAIMNFRSKKNSRVVMTGDQDRREYFKEKHKVKYSETNYLEFN
ncbi:MAG: hypothetical protein ACPGUH_04735 [Winogradskyella sp.]